MKKGQIVEKLSEKSSFFLLKSSFWGIIEFLDFLADRVFAQTPKKKPGEMSDFAVGAI